MRSLFNLIVIQVLFFTSGFVHAQGSLMPEWFIKRTSPVNNTNAEAWGIAVDTGGSIYWATNQTRPGIFQGFDVVFYKLDSENNEIWSAPTIFAGQFAQQSYKVTVANGVAYIGGRNCRSISLNLETCDMLIIAVDVVTGDTLWTTTWDQGFGYEEADGIVVESDGIYVTGWTDGETTDLDIALVKLDLNGDILWTNTWGTDEVDHQDGHIAVDDSVIYIAGLYNGETNPVVALKGLNGNALLAKFSKADGTYLAHTAFGREDAWQNFENALGMTSDGDFLYLVGVTTVAENNNDIFLAKYDKNLNQIWYETWGGATTETARAIAAAKDGSIYIGGNTNSFGDQDFDIVILKYSPDGQLLSYKTWGGAALDQTLDITTDQGYLYATGKSQSFNSNQNYDAILLKVDLDSLVTSIRNLPTVQQFSLQQNYPNPFNPRTTIKYQLPKTENVKIKIFNQLGQEVKTLVDEAKPPGQYKIDWDGRNNYGLKVSTGLYVVRMEAGEFTESKKIILLR